MAQGTAYKFRIYARNIIGDSQPALTNVVTAPTPTKVTVFDLNVPIVIGLVTDLLGSLGLVPHSFTEESADAVGGYENTGMAQVTDAKENYEALRQDSGVEGPPMIKEFSVFGEIPAANMAALPVQSSQVIDTTELAPPEDPPTRAPDSIYVPASGRILMTDDYPVTQRTNRRIVNTMTWDTQQAIDDFGDQYAYEHDVKFLDSTNSSLNHPFCTPGDLENFWILRGRSISGLYWSTNMPAAARPYLDTPILDECTSQDFSIGVAYPQELSPNVEYRTVVSGIGTVEAGTGTGGREYELAAQKVQKNPDGCYQRGSWIRYCVGIPPHNDSENEPLVKKLSEMDAEPRRAPECRSWIYLINTPGGSPCQ